MDYLQVSKYEMQIKKYEMLINQPCYNPILYINPYPIYNPINYQMWNPSNPINNGSINKETTIENKEVEKMILMIFDYNREFIYQSEWDKYGCDLEEYNSISDDEKRLFEDCINEIEQFSEILYFNTSILIFIKYGNENYFGNGIDNCRKYSFLEKDFNYELKQSIIDKNLEQLNKKFQAYKNYKQNKQFIDKYYDKIVLDNVQTNYDYIDELIKESKE